MDNTLFFLFASFVSLLVNVMQHRNCQKTQLHGTKKTGIVNYRFWKNAEIMKNQWHLYLTAIVAFETTDHNIIEKELTHKRRFYLPPPAGELIELVVYEGEVYDQRMLNRYFEIVVSAIAMILCLLAYFL